MFVGFFHILNFFKRKKERYFIKFEKVVSNDLNGLLVCTCCLLHLFPILLQHFRVDFPLPIN